MQLIQLAESCSAARLGQGRILAGCHPSLESVRSSLQQSVDDFTLPVVQADLGMALPELRPQEDPIEQFFGAPN